MPLIDTTPKDQDGSSGTVWWQCTFRPGTTEETFQPSSIAYYQAAVKVLAARCFYVESRLSDSSEHFPQRMIIPRKVKVCDIAMYLISGDDSVNEASDSVNAIALYWRNMDRGRGMSRHIEVTEEECPKKKTVWKKWISLSGDQGEYG